MTTTYAYPSERFPAPPQVTVSAPDDWIAATVPGSVLAARALRPAAQFAPNVVVSVGRHAGEFGREQALTMVRGALFDHPEAKLDEPFLALFGDDVYHVVNVAFDDPQAGTLIQVHAYCGYPVPGRAQECDVVRVMGTCSAVDTVDDYPLLQQVIESTRVVSPTG